MQIMLDLFAQQEISIQVIKTHYSRFESFPEDSSKNRNAPFHEAFLNAFSDKLSNKVPDIPFFISLSSWLHGLSTTLGQTFFENVAHFLSSGEKKAFTKVAGYSISVTNKQKEEISNIIIDLKNANRKPELDYENKLLFDAIKNSEKGEAINFTADVFIESEKEINAIELKTVKPNAGIMMGEKQKILEAKAALMHIYPDKKINYFIGFPFDPTSFTPTESDKIRFLNSIVDGIKYFDLREVLLGEELWDFLSGKKGTMKNLLDIINKIATPEFLEIYNYLNESKNRITNQSKYIELLKNWNLFNELEIINLFLKNGGRLDEKRARLYWQSIFSNGEYKQNRYINLLKN